jgi:alpha-ketoglutarate-dependent taurine dioxygenase
MKMTDLVSSIEKDGFISLTGDAAKSIKDKIEGEEFGRLLPQNRDGTKIYNVKPKTGVKNTASSEGSLFIAPHTDGALTDQPPKYLGLFGQHVPKDEKCRTYVCKVTELFNSLKPEEREILKLPNPSEGTFRYSFQQALYGDFWITEDRLRERSSTLTQEVSQAMKSMTDAFERHGNSFVIGQNDLLIIDNHEALHYRDNVTSSERHLLRYWIGD